MDSLPSGMLPLTMVKGRKHSGLCSTFFGIWPRHNITSTRMSLASKQRQAKASQMAMPTFKGAGKHNLTMFLEGGESETFGEWH